LHTATDERPAGVSEMNADVVWTACQTNVAGLKPGRMEPCRSASDRRLSPACTARAQAHSTSAHSTQAQTLTDAISDRRNATQINTINQRHSPLAIK